MRDIDRICISLIESYGFKYSKKEEVLSSPLIRWLEFVSRYVPESPRQVVVSSQLETKLINYLPKKTVKEFRVFSKHSTSGCDLNPFQSKSLIHNDSSDNKKQKRTDLLFADWGILHFHLSCNIKTGEYFSKRSDWLLFSIVYGNFIFCIDALNHSDKNIFSRLDMLEIIYKNWPFLLEPYEMKEVMVGINNTDSDISMLRKAGVSSCCSVCNKVFFPRGLGISSAGISSKNMEMVNNVKRGVKRISEIIEAPSSSFTQVRNNPSKYELSLVPEGLALYDINNDIAYMMPRNNSEKDILAILHDLVVPDWVSLKEG